MFEEIGTETEQERTGENTGMEQYTELNSHENPNLSGHTHIEHMLAGLIEKKRLPHGMIFSGPPGIGKATMAYRVTRKLLQEKQNDADQNLLFENVQDAVDDSQTLQIETSDPVFKKVARLAHPDLMVVQRRFDETRSRFKESVEIDDIRKAIAFLRMKAAYGGWRVVIIDDASTMNRNAQNALLKILEEPPRNSVVILVAHVLGNLLATTRSRCRLISFDKLDNDIMHELVGNARPELTAKARYLLLKLSGGSIGKALEMYDEGGMEGMETALKCFENWPAPDWDTLHSVADRYMGQGQQVIDDYENFTYCLLWILKNLVRAKAERLETHNLPVENDGLSRFYAEHDLFGLLDLSESINNQIQQGKAGNLKAGQVTLGLVFTLYDNKYKLVYD